MITSAVTGFVRKRFKKAYRYYRVFYNFMALATLAPVLVYSFSIQELPIFRWEGPFRIVQGLLAEFGEIHRLSATHVDAFSVQMGVAKVDR